MLGIIIQARVSSTRLPKKVLKPILGATTIEREIERVKKTKFCQKIILAIPDGKKDNALEIAGKKSRVLVYRGSEHDVLDRFYQAAKKFNLEHIVRITGDCPLFDWQICDEVINFYLQNKYDYVSNVRPPTFPDGLDVEVFSFKALEKSWKNAKLKLEREHITLYIASHPEIFKIGNLKRSGKDLSALRLTLDESKDLVLIRKIYRALYKKKKYFDLDDILKLFGQRPELLKINQSIKRNEGLLKSIKNDKNYEFARKK
ncbi:MAG: glycosyltransferase family protein [Candidatus Pacebacteria bacterium]|nr:glycosyltransferase family protein [Candidatus Paceibacterota bacterium]